MNPMTDDTVYFNSTSYDPDGTIINWTWNFDDGNYTYTENTTHSYASKGDYTVNLTVKDDDDATAYIEKTIVVGIQPVAVIDEIYPLIATYGEIVSFKGHGTTHEGTIVDYNWTSDIDGKISNEANFAHSSLSIGTHNISFKVKNSLGVWSKQATKTLKILPMGSKPDLAINSLMITFSDHNPIINDTIWINATVHNIGSMEAENITVAFYNMTPGNQTLIESYIIEYIPSQPASRTASIQWSIPPDAYIGYHVINVSVDPDNAINETYERNNIAYLPIVIREQEGDLPPIIGMNVTGLQSGLEYTKGQSINVFGDSWYEYENWTLPVCGGEVTITIVETGAKWTTWTSGSKIHGGEYSYIISAQTY
jgi:PKD repeat protein